MFILNDRSVDPCPCPSKLVLRFRFFACRRVLATSLALVLQGSDVCPRRQCSVDVNDDEEKGDSYSNGE